MNNKSKFNRIEKGNYNLKNEESDYDNLINKLKEIRSIILLLEKQYLDNF